MAIIPRLHPRAGFLFRCKPCMVSPTISDESITPAMNNALESTAEHFRLEEEKQYKAQNGLWRKWGPYLSERQWGTVREDYSPYGNAWEHLSHDHARSRAYRWGEDGIAGFSDHHQRLCLSLVLWNERDPILKERLFGLTNSEGNHGEDGKELYYYLDATPTHSYLKMLYKYPQREFPYADLVNSNRSRGKHEPEYELLDTGVLDEDRYFDLFVEYARINPTDVNMLVTVHNRGPENATLHLLPQLWFRNTWSWRAGAPKPQISARDPQSVNVAHRDMGKFQFFVENTDEWLFTDNETNVRRLYNQQADGYFKDAFHEYIIRGDTTAVNPGHTGTKVAAHVTRVVPASGSLRVRACLRAAAEGSAFESFDEAMEIRRVEADVVLQ